MPAVPGPSAGATAAEACDELEVHVGAVAHLKLSSISDLLVHLLVVVIVAVVVKRFEGLVCTFALVSSALVVELSERVHVERES